MTKKTISAIIPVIGDYLQVQPPLAHLVSQLSEAFAIDGVRLEVIFVADGAHWNQTIDASDLPASAPSVFITEPAQSMPACLFNRGAQEARGDYVAFLWPGTPILDWTHSLSRLAMNIKDGEPAVAGRVAHFATGEHPVESWLWSCEGFEPNGYPSGWIELADIVPMEATLVRRSVFQELGGFSTSPLLQRGFWWDFSLRLSRRHEIRSIDVASPQSRWSWHVYPLTADVGVSGDMMARRVMRGAGTVHSPAGGIEVDWADVASFALSIADADLERLNRQLRRFASIAGLENACLPDARESPMTPLRLTVLGGPNEPAHNQLCFFNFFQLLERDNLITWRTSLDTAATSADMLNSDLVIFSRVKTQAGCALMEFCKANGIPTIYMLDDNWFSIGSEWKEYEGLFKPGAPMFENFMFCLERADVCLTYNKVLAEDLAPYAPNLVVMPTNIDLSLFQRQPREPRKKKIVGYVGSARQDTSAFRALRELVEERDDVEVFVMSNAVPEELRSLPAGKVQFQPYVFSYKRYAEIVCRRAPDILIAPLGETRTEASKCPNKYLEIAAVGAAGVFSKVEPYVSHIAHDKTGIMVEDRADEWKDAIRGLLDNEDARASVARQALAHVTDHFSTERVLDQFWTLIRNTANTREFQR
ncbi:glycosyltransferase [Caballeronia telluris]|uniref:Glycosyltransferase-like protein n=1 Tax=Caballeronia telluris TaxID=326475 RepID=A0A158IY01_9BURK|nr:glycosyltransferase [Caballeronia telluris]SAL61478.1 glycosyltransferase-like protein [Caballeronia telluris]